MENHTEIVEGIFDRAAPKYGEVGSDYFSYFGDRLVEQSSVKEGDAVLDVGTGKGALLFPLIRRVGSKGKVVGIDISKKMIEECLKKLSRGTSHQVLLQVMNAENLHFSDHSFEHVVCGLSLGFFSNLNKTLLEFRRVLKLRGEVAVSILGKRSELNNWMRLKACELGAKGSIVSSVKDRESLVKALQEVGFEGIRVVEESCTFYYASPQEWWNSLWANSLRFFLEQLSADQLHQMQIQALEKAKATQTHQGVPEEFQIIYVFGRGK